MIGTIVSIVCAVMMIIMIIVYVATRNHIVDIVTSFETQNTDAYQIKVETFTNAITFLSNFDGKMLNDINKVCEMGDIFDKLLMCSSRQDTLSTFEKYIEMKVDGEQENTIMLLEKFKQCVRMEFGAKKYKSRYVTDVVMEKLSAKPKIPNMTQPQKVATPYTAQTTNSVTGVGGRVQSPVGNAYNGTAPTGGTVISNKTENKE